MNSCLILTEAGEGIGFGHLMRCTGILDALNDSTQQHSMLLSVKGDLNIEHPAIQPGDWLNRPALVEALKENYNIILIDSYLASAEYYAFLQVHFSTVLVIDDYKRIDYPTPYILNPNIYGNDLGYELRPEQQLFAGQDYVILRQEFRDGHARFDVREKLQNVLITVGGSDIRGLIPKLLGLIPEGYDIHIITGKETYKEELELEFASVRNHFNGFVSAGQMKELMLNCDVCISANGQTLHELAFLGVPTIGICIDIDQIPNTKQYSQSNILQGELMWDAEDFNAQVLDALNAYQDKAIRLKKSTLGKAFIDGRGVYNIAEIIRSL